MKSQTFAIALLALASSALNLAAVGQSAGVIGFWSEPGGSIIHVDRCGANVCATLVGIGKSTPYTVDGENPDPALKKRPLCGLMIGYGFNLKDPEHAEDGKLYDPKSGKTYKGSLSAHGDSLNLRGYIGIKAFGRSETWTRTSAAAITCAKAVAKG